MVPNLASPSSPAESSGPPTADGWLDAGGRIDAVRLAPLSGITDAPFRALVRSFGTRTVYSEMVASGELLRREPESLMRIAADGAGPRCVQLAGRDADAMREAAAFVAGEGAALIDINMGCPAKKVVGGLSGAALMRDLDHAEALIEATVRGAGDVPVTLKMRLGWDRASIVAPALARRAEAAGVRLVTVHGRTRDQFYEGRADWRAIRDVVEAVSIPVVANGDLVETADHAAMLRASGAAGVMIGRGACGRPWFPALVAGRLSDEGARRTLRAVAVEHYEAMLSHYGAGIGVRHARKHLGWYLDTYAQLGGTGLDGDRAALMRETQPAAVVRHLALLFRDITVGELECGRRTEAKAA